MPSGKKARGRQNRAKKEAARTAELRTQWEPAVLRYSSVNNAAASSLAVIPCIPPEGPAVSFMNCLAGEGFFNRAKIFGGIDPVELCFQSLRDRPDVLAVESERSLAINLLLRFIRNVFVNESAMEGEELPQLHHHNREVVICCMINALELQGTYSDRIVVTRRAVKMRNKLLGGNRRDTVKFVAKRLPCTCLKKLHSAARKELGKVFKCECCGNKFPRSQLLVCTGCMVGEYCSKACQRAHWSFHKPYCGHPELVSRDLPADYLEESLLRERLLLRKRQREESGPNHKQNTR